MTRRVLFFGSYDRGPGYPRARSLRQALEAYGVEVHEVQRSLLPERGKRHELVRKPWRWPFAALSSFGDFRALGRELEAALAEFAPDVVLVPYPGWFSVRQARKIWKGPLVLDLFMSLQDTVVADRRMFRSGGAVDRWLGRIDRRACQAADRVLLDTPQHVAAVAELTGTQLASMGFVPVGDPDAAEQAKPFPPIEGRVELLFVGTGVPLQGIDTLLEACEASAKVSLTFVGGSEEQRARARALGERCARVEAWLDREEIARLADRSHVVAGVFGETAKAQRVVPFKALLALSHGRVLLTAETEAVSTLLEPGADCFTVPIADPEAIARSLDELAQDPERLERVGRLGRARYESTFSPVAIGRRLIQEFEAVTGSSWEELETAPDEASREPQTASAS